MPSFQEGLSNSLAKGVSDVGDSILAMSMLSKKIEMEQKARMAEAEQQHQLNTLPKGALSAGLSVLGVSKDKADALESLFPDGAPQGVLQELGGPLGMGMRAQAMMNRPTHVVSKPDHNNLVAAGFQEPLTGDWIGQPQVTLDPHAQQELEKVDSSVQNAKNMVGGLLQRAQAVLPDSPTGVPINKLDAYWQSKGMPTNPDLKAFQDSLGSLSAQYIKDTTGMAPRSEQLMHLDMAAFPNPSDDVQSALAKAQILQETMGNKSATAHTIYDPTNFLQSPLHPKSQGAQEAQNKTNQATDSTMSSLQQLAAQEIQRRKSLRGATNAPKQ